MFATGTASTGAPPAVYELKLSRQAFGSQGNDAGSERTTVAKRGNKLRPVQRQVDGGPTADRKPDEVELRFGERRQDLVQPGSLIRVGGDRTALDAQARFAQQVNGVDIADPEERRKVAGPDRRAGRAPGNQDEWVIGAAGTCEAVGSDDAVVGADIQGRRRHRHGRERRAVGCQVTVLATGTIPVANRGRCAEEQRHPCHGQPGHEHRNGGPRPLPLSGCGGEAWCYRALDPHRFRIHNHDPRPIVTAAFAW